MKTSLKISSFLFALLLTVSCQKYDDGPFFSLASKKARMANNWRLEKAYDGSKDITSEYNRYELDLGKSGSARTGQSYDAGGIVFNYETNGSWNFVNNNENLLLDFEDDDADQVYTILRLQQSSLWIREVGNGKEFHLIPR